MNKIKKIFKEPAYIFLSVFLLFTLTLILYNYFFEKEIIITPNEEVSIEQIEIELEASSAIIYDVLNKEIVAAKNIYTPLPIASITKLPAALIASRYLSKADISKLTEDDRIIFPNTQLVLGEEWISEELLRYSLITSANRGINAVARTVEEKVGTSLTDLMNRFAEESNLIQTHFINPTGLDTNNTLSGSESSAYDLALIATSFIEENPILAKKSAVQNETFYSTNNRRYLAKNTNILIGNIENDILLSKTGFTDIAGGTLVMVINSSDDSETFKPIALVILNSSRSGRFTDMRKLIDLFNSNYRS